MGSGPSAFGGAGLRLGVFSLGSLGSLLETLDVGFHRSGGTQEGRDLVLVAQGLLLGGSQVMVYTTKVVQTTALIGVGWLHPAGATVNMSGPNLAS